MLRRKVKLAANPIAGVGYSCTYLFALSGSRTPAMGECPRPEVVDEQVPANRQHKARLPRLRAEDAGVEHQEKPNLL